MRESPHFHKTDCLQKNFLLYYIFHITEIYSSLLQFHQSVINFLRCIWLLIMDRFTQTGLGICKSSMLQHNFQKFRAFPFQKFRCFFSDCIAEHSQCGNAVSLCHLCEITGSKTAAVCGSCEQAVKNNLSAGDGSCQVLHYS